MRGDVEAILRSGKQRARQPRTLYDTWRNVKDIFGVVSYECSVLTKLYGLVGGEQDTIVMRWVKVVVWDGYPAFWSWNGGQ